MQVLPDTNAHGDARGSVLSIGVFDGVHLGHQTILADVVSRAHARGLAASVVTFAPHPARALDPARAPLLLESLDRRLARFEELGLDQARVITFNASAARESAEGFVERVLVGEMACRTVVVGEDFRFGHDREGDVRALSRWGQRYGFDVDGVAAIGRTERYSSSHARSYVRRGDLRAAEGVLGHHVLVSGEVIHGDARGGSELGFPTANLATLADLECPGVGVYAGAARLADGRWFAAALSIGRRPQFLTNAEVTIEAHLVNFEGDLYGQWMDLVLLDFLRGEATFASVDDLIAQMGRDVARSVEIFGKFSSEPELLLGFATGQRR